MHAARLQGASTLQDERACKLLRRIVASYSNIVEYYTTHTHTPKHRSPHTLAQIRNILQTIVPSRLQGAAL